jgi:hypothetical protein
VNVLDTQTNLREPVDDLVFLKIFRLLFGFLDSRGQVSFTCVLHYDIKFHFRSPINLLKANDVGMVESLQYFGLSQGSLLLLDTHVGNDDLFDYKLLPGFNLFD